MLKQIVEGTVTPPSELDPEYNQPLEEIVMRALEKEQDKRYQTAREHAGRSRERWCAPIGCTSRRSRCTQFMEETFGHKIEAWREAQAKGKSLGEHLEKLPVPVENALADDDLEEIGETQAREAERIAAERAAFRQKIERATSGVHDVAPASLDAVTRALGGPAPMAAAELPELKRKPPWLVIGTAAIVAVVGVAVVLHSRKAPEPAPATVNPPPVAAAPTTPVATTARTRRRRSRRKRTSPRPMSRRRPSRRPSRRGTSCTSRSMRRRQRRARARPAATPKAPAGPKPAPLAAIQSPDAKKEPAAPVKLEGEGTLLLATSPWCNVKIDGVDKGPTPLNVKLHAGQHTVVLSNPEFKINRTIPVMILPNETNRKRYDF